MEGQQLPKATMISFIKKQTNSQFSLEFIAKILHLSRDFITRLADKSNQICEENNKKTINAEHLEAALQKFGLDKHLSQLKQLGSNIKEVNELKREASKRLEETIKKERKEQSEKRLIQQPQRKRVVVREYFDQIEVDNNDEDYDYEGLVQNEQKVE